ncbi:MAG TPA: DUF5666 domain-containing protein [Vicinamibacterales bacterium]|nr:DUF5666 domain-containing protein [Vicinamibacterales bacterium]
MHRFLLPLIVIFATAACGGSSSPTGPGGVAGGASITGRVLSGASSSLTAASTGSAIPGLVVTVAGTEISSGLDATGTFSLNGVPAGDVELQFSGPVTATLPLSQVKPAEKITLVVAVSSTTITLESQSRSGAGQEQLEGRVESLPPTMLVPGSLKVAGRTVTTDASTQFRQGGTAMTFDDLEIGYRVHVTGVTVGTSLKASFIEIQNTNATIPVNVNGVIDDLGGSASEFQFEIGSRLIKGDANTEFFGDGDDADTFADLENGVRVEVKGVQRDGFVYAQRIHINGDDEDGDDDQESSASIHGTLTAITGSVLTVGGTTVHTTSSTEVKRRGDVQTLAELRIGQDLHVIGVRQPDGSIDARRIEINDDATGGEFEIEGSAGGVSGACLTLSFSINGYSIRTTATTIFDGIACSAIKSGTQLKVHGISQSDNSVVATVVKPS